MPKPTTGDRLAHMLEAIEGVAGYLAGKSFDDYRREPILRDAVERRIERISEASRHIPDALKATAPQIPWRAVAAIGNILRHDYEGVRGDEVWRIATRDLPLLRTAVEAMIRALPADD
jgi:uncharacterized protein with HEPN domain